MLACMPMPQTEKALRLRLLRLRVPILLIQLRLRVIQSLVIRERRAVPPLTYCGDKENKIFFENIRKQNFFESILTPCQRMCIIFILTQCQYHTG
jgi:hypothetical protein